MAYDKWQMADAVRWVCAGLAVLTAPYQFQLSIVKDGIGGATKLQRMERAKLETKGVSRRTNTVNQCAAGLTGAK